VLVRGRIRRRILLAAGLLADVLHGVAARATSRLLGRLRRGVLVARRRLGVRAVGLRDVAVVPRAVNTHRDVDVARSDLLGRRRRTRRLRVVGLLISVLAGRAVVAAALAAASLAQRSRLRAGVLL